MKLHLAWVVYVKRCANVSVYCHIAHMNILSVWMLSSSFRITSTHTHMPKESTAHCMRVWVVNANVNTKKRVFFIEIGCVDLYLKDIYIYSILCNVWIEWISFANKIASLNRIKCARRIYDEKTKKKQPKSQKIEQQNESTNQTKHEHEPEYSQKTFEVIPI